MNNLPPGTPQLPGEPQPVAPEPMYIPEGRTALPPGYAENAPQAPPYTMPPYGTYPPTTSYPAYPGQWAYGGTPAHSPDAPRNDAIGPEHVPWHWYDVLLPALPFIFTALAAAFTPVSKGGTTATNTTVPGVNHDKLLILNLVFSVIVYGYALGMIWWRTVRTYHVPWSALGLRKAPPLAFALMIPVYFVMALVAGGLGELVNKLFYGGGAQNPQIDAITGGGGFSWVALITAVLSASIIAPIVEELLFRGMLYGLFRSRWPSAVLAVTVDAALFAAAHGIGLILASIFVVGMTLCIVYEKTKSTLVTITLHSLFNTVSVATVFIMLATGGKPT